MENKFIDKDYILDYICKKFDFFSDRNSLTCEEIGDGNINYVYRILDKKSGKSLVVKKSHELLRTSLRPLDTKRSAIEAKSLMIKNDLAKGSCPEIYLFDPENSIIVMEDIGDYKNLRKELMEGRVYENFPENIGDFLAKSLLPTTDLVLSRKEKKQRVIDFTNPDMCDISEDLVFTEPYYDYKKRNNISPGLEEFVRIKLYENKDLQREVLLLKDRFQNYSQALVHGDLHTGSIFVNENGIKVIDSEFAFYGPMGYDYGNLWANLIFPLARAYVLGEDEKLIERLKSFLEETVDLSTQKLYQAFDDYVFLPYFRNPSFKEVYLGQVLADSFGYGGCELIRRTVGDSSVPDLESIGDGKDRQKIDKILIEMGIYLISNRERIKSGQDLVRVFERISRK